LLVVAVPCARADEACVWGQPGYRDCVDKLIAAKKEADAKKPQGNGAAAGEGAAAQKAGTVATNGKKGTKSTRRPGAGSLTPVPPAELRLTPPRYDALEQAIASERRQRQMDQNLYRMQRDSAQPLILPPVVNPPLGRICPSWGC
jgi:hypothetical protein